MNSGTVDIAEHIGDNYESLIGICPLNDTEGVLLTSIRHSSEPKIDSKLNEMFRKWLAGSGRMPVTWTFVKCLCNVKLNRLADTIEEEYISEPAEVGDTKPLA